MRKPNVVMSALSLAAISMISSAAFAQKAKPAVKPVPKPERPAIFAVLNDGKSLEPIALVSGGKLLAPANGSDAQNVVSTFTKTYYKPARTYTVVFGGAASGTATVKSSDPKAECSKNLATVSTSGLKTPLKGLLMALATSLPKATAETSYRRKPTSTEKSEIDGLAKAEFAKQKLTPKVLHYQNLTGIDVDRDGTAEFVGSYWVEIDKLTRGLLFLIASKGPNGKYSVGFSEYRPIDQANVMSGEIKSVDDGVYHELLLDSLDVDGDGRNEIFTYTQSFEGAGFNAYAKSGSKWKRVYEFANYHCGY